MPREKTTDLILKWNTRNKTIKTPYTEEEILNTVYSAYGRYADRTYGCNNVFLQRKCLGQTNCEYLQKVNALNPSKGSGFNKNIFYKYGWQKILKVAPTYTYLSVLSLLEEEKRRNVGDWIFTSYAEIAHYLGKSVSYVNSILSELEQYKLIAWKHGKRGEKHTPTKIKRIVPIPKPRQTSL